MRVNYYTNILVSPVLIVSKILISNSLEKERLKEKEAKIQKEALNRVDRWVRTGKKEGWVKIKTK